MILFTPMVVRNGRSHGVKCASLRFLRSFEQRDVAKFQVQMSSMPSIQGWPRLLQDQQTPIDLASLVSLVASSGQAPTTGSSDTGLKFDKTAFSFIQCWPFS